MLCQMFLSPQVKRGMITSNKHAIYALSHELPNYLRLLKDKNNLKTPWNYNLAPSLPLPPKNLANTSQTLLENRN